ncbi:uncharacterized protein LOC135477955 [Liolophura sinensis]|uniref:uncharacterized protein LOC135477955 n=1 Tax=Liolophura sinensis TaxID=3198878 RepID=UPI003158B086
MASFKEQLLKQKLKPSPEPMKDFSSPKMAGFIKQADIDEYQGKVLDVNTEKWLDLLKDVTFTTCYSSISIEQARLFVNVYERIYKNLDHRSICRLSWEDKLLPEENVILEGMRTELAIAMNEYVKEGYVFVKTSSRSPKDGPLAQERLEHLYRQRLSSFPEEDRSKENTKLTTLLQVCFDAMMVKSAEEVMDLFMRSERIYQDMLLALAVPDRFHENFVIRQFVPIDVDMEFRGFVYNHDLVALSQYNYLIFSQRLLEQQGGIEQKLIKFFETEVRTRLMSEAFSSNFIIDFAISQNGTPNEKLWVIEINPYLETTDGALFSWQHERHLLEGKGGFQFRITTRPKPGAKAMLPTRARDLLNEN